MHLKLFWLWLKRDLRSRYVGSLGGVFWSVLQPIVTIGLFYVLFTYVFKVRIPELADQSGFFYYLLAGILPWMAISEGLSRSASTLINHEQFLRKQAFPIAILPSSVLIGALPTQLIGFAILLPMLAASGLLHWHVAYLLPLIFGVQILMTLGMALALSILALHVRDIPHGLPLALQFLFYATPILYPMDLVPSEFHNLFMLNPFAPLIMAYQSVLTGIVINPIFIYAGLAWALILGGGGYALYRILKPTVGEAL